MTMMMSALVRMATAATIAMMSTRTIPVLGAMMDAATVATK